MKIVAELSANHNGKLERALQIVAAAKQAGANAVKLQTWTPGRMVLDSSLILRDGPWVGMKLAELYEKAHMPWEEQRQVFAFSKDVGIECFSSVFDLPSLDFLERQGCPIYKIASFEIVDLPLIHAVASTKKPIVISTGMATHVEIQEAVQTARAGGAKSITLLKCTSAYPADGSEANLRTMRYYEERFESYPGLSDHTEGIGVGIVAAALGASMLEKHVTLSRADGGLDAAFSIEPAELATLVHEAERVRLALGTVSFGPTEHERPQLELRRSLYFTQDLPAGTYLSADHICSARPAKGLAPRHTAMVQGCRLTQPVRRGQAVLWDMLEKKKQPAIS